MIKSILKIIGTSIIGLIVFAGCMALLVDDSNRGDINITKLSHLSANSNFQDIISIVGKPCFIHENKFAPLPNFSMGYTTKRWVIVMIYKGYRTDLTREKSFYIGTIDLEGHVIHIPDEKYRLLIESYAVAVKNQ